MAFKQPTLVTEDWKKDYEKIILSRKFAAANASIGNAFAEPSDGNVKAAFGAAVDCIGSMTIGDDKDNREKRDDFLKRLDEIETVIYGKADLRSVQELYKKYGVMTTPTRVGVKMVDRLQNLPELLKHLRNILVEANDFSTAVGLRVTLPKHKKFGLERMLEEEGFDSEDLDEYTY